MTSYVKYSTKIYEINSRHYNFYIKNYVCHVKQKRIFYYFWDTLYKITNEYRPNVIIYLNPLIETLRWPNIN